MEPVLTWDSLWKPDLLLWWHDEAKRHVNAGDQGKPSRQDSEELAALGSRVLPLPWISTGTIEHDEEGEEELLD